MKVTVFGATGATGREAVRALLGAGHEVRAFVRGEPEGLPSRVELARGDVLDFASVDAAVRGSDAVVVTLGIRENPLLVLLRGASKTSTEVRSVGTRNIVEAMNRHGVKRLVVQTTYGVGATRGRPSWMWRMIFSSVLRPQIADTEIQEALVRASGLDWVVVQPVGLTDGDPQDLLKSVAGDARSMQVPRRSVGDFLAEAVTSASYVRECVALSA